MLSSVKSFSTADEWTEGGTWKSAQRFVPKGIVGGISVDGREKGWRGEAAQMQVCWSGVGWSKAHWNRSEGQGHSLHLSWLETALWAPLTPVLLWSH